MPRSSMRPFNVLTAASVLAAALLAVPAAAQDPFHAPEPALEICNGELPALEPGQTLQTERLWFKTTTTLWSADALLGEPQMTTTPPAFPDDYLQEGRAIGEGRWTATLPEGRTIVCAIIDVTADNPSYVTNQLPTELSATLSVDGGAEVASQPVGDDPFVLVGGTTRGFTLRFDPLSLDAEQTLTARVIGPDEATVIEYNSLFGDGRVDYVYVVD